METQLLDEQSHNSSRGRPMMTAPTMTGGFPLSSISKAQQKFPFSKLSLDSSLKKSKKKIRSLFRKPVL